MKNFLRRTVRTLFVLGCLFPAVARAVPWVEFHDLTESQLQNEFDTWGGPPWNLRATRVSGSETSGGKRYAVIFEKSTKTTEWSMWVGMTSSEFVTTNTNHQANGYRLVWLDGFEVGNTAYYNGIWEKNGGAAQRVRVGDLYSTFTNANSTNTDDGYLLSDVNAFSINGTTYYAAVWTAGIGLDIQVRYNLTGAAYQTEFNTLAGQGYSVYRVSGAENAGSARYTGVWRRTSPGEGWSIHGMSASGFDAETINARMVGYRLVQVDAFNIGTATYYNALWVRNGGFSTSRLSAIQTDVSAYMTSRNLPGLSLAISHEGRLVYARGFGYADTSTGEKAHALHRWRIASTSKTICAVSALRALEDSPSWSLGSKCFGSGALFGSDYGNTATYPYNDNEKAMTLRQVMNMAAGWNSQGHLWYESDPALGTNHAAIVDYQLDHVNPVWTPGTKYGYNNFNYQLVARIPEKISGLSFFLYTYQQVFNPCGMTSMSLGGRTAADRLSNEVAYYPGNVFGDPETVWPSRMDGSTAWICRPKELLLLGRRIDGDSRYKDIIGSYALSQMQLANGLPDADGDISNYGMGWYPSTSNGHTWWQHNGSMSGTQALLCVSDDGSQGFAYATNSVNDDDEYSGKFRNMVLNDMQSIENSSQWPDIDLSGAWNPAYDSWADSAFGTKVTSQTGLLEFWSPGADPDGDGRPNAMEAYIGSNPLAVDSASWGSVKLTDNDLIFRWRLKEGDRGVDAIAEGSTNLNTWYSFGTVMEPDPDVIFHLIGYDDLRGRVARSGAVKKYIRLRFDTH